MSDLPTNSSFGHDGQPSMKLVLRDRAARHMSPGDGYAVEPSSTSDRCLNRGFAALHRSGFLFRCTSKRQILRDVPRLIGGSCPSVRLSCGPPKLVFNNIG
jgi:hypothetical protein